MDNSEGPDFGSGVDVRSLSDGAMLLGKFGGEDVIVARRGNEFFAVGANCSHYGGPLAKGLMLGDEIRCPLHHACFSLRTGEALRPPAFDADFMLARRTPRRKGVPARQIACTCSKTGSPSQWGEQPSAFGHHHWRRRRRSGRCRYAAAGRL